MLASLDMLGNVFKALVVVLESHQLIYCTRCESNGASKSLTSFNQLGGHACRSPIRPEHQKRLKSFCRIIRSSQMLPGARTICTRTEDSLQQPKQNYGRCHLRADINFGVIPLGLPTEALDELFNLPIPRASATCENLQLSSYLHQPFLLQWQQTFDVT